MQHSLPMSVHSAPTHGTSPSLRATSKTLHIYCYNYSNTPYVFLQRLQLLYGRIQRAAICNHREKRASGAYPPQRLENGGLNTAISWILKAEFTTVERATNAYNGILNDTGSATASSNVPFGVDILSSFVLDEEDSLVDLSRVSNARDAVGLPCSSHMVFQTLHNTIQSGERHNSGHRNTGTESVNTSAPADIQLTRQSGSEDGSCSSRAASTASSSKFIPSSENDGIGMNSPESSSPDGQSDPSTSRIVIIKENSLHPQPFHTRQGSSFDSTCWEDLTNGFSNINLKVPTVWNDSVNGVWTTSGHVAPSHAPTQSSENSRRRLSPRMEALQQSMPTFASIPSSTFKNSVAATAASDRIHSPSSTPMPIHSTSIQCRIVGPITSTYSNHRHSPSFTPSSPQPSQHSDSGSQSSYSPSVTSISATTDNTNKSNSGRSKKHNNKKSRQDKRLYTTDPHVGPRPTDWMLSEDTIKTREARDARFMQIVALGLAPGRTKSGWAQARRPGKRDRDAAKAKLREMEEETERERLRALLG